ncbi:hypothetical protein [Natronococcus wangiae]|uniref:hypothetical protein n=1 Tax=Natronococcus wangiae TaxID=3068275 RepID=UPI003133A559
MIGNSDISEQFEGFGGTKVELALAGWVQLQSDQLIDRVNIDASDGFDNAGLVREFAQMHNAGSIAVALYPSGNVLTTEVSDLSLSGNGAHVPVSVHEAQSNGR